MKDTTNSSSHGAWYLGQSDPKSVNTNRDSFRNKHSHLDIEEVVFSKCGQMDEIHILAVRQCRHQCVCTYH